MLATTKGKAHALRALTKRRAASKGKTPTDNGALYAGSPMWFPCDACGTEFSVPESYQPPRRRLCEECDALKACGWLDN